MKTFTANSRKKNDLILSDLNDNNSSAENPIWIAKDPSVSILFSISRVLSLI